MRNFQCNQTLVAAILSEALVYGRSLIQRDKIAHSSASEDVGSVLLIAIPISGSNAFLVSKI